jgi:hypothetical protein
MRRTVGDSLNSKKPLYYGAKYEKLPFFEIAKNPPKLRWLLQCALMREIIRVNDISNRRIDQRVFYKLAKYSCVATTVLIIIFIVYINIKHMKLIYIEIIMKLHFKI